jgi:hypothetical protein
VYKHETRRKTNQQGDPKYETMKTWSSNILVCLFLGFSIFSQKMSAQQPAPYNSIPPPSTVNTNGATILPDNSQMYPTSPNGGQLIQNSPVASTNFQGLGDNNFFYPPDTMGAVGTNYVVTMLNTQVRIHTRAGATVTNMALTDFWTSTNVGNFYAIYDPRILYDPYNDRWIASATVDPPAPRGTNSGILLGVSRTSSPTTIGDAGWNLHRVKGDPSELDWPDFPMLGFNKDWIVVSADMMTQGGTFDGENFFVFNKTNLYAGGFTNPTVLSDTNLTYAGVEFPATTYDTSLSTLYIVQDYIGNFQGSGYIRMLSITGAIGAETLNNGGTNPVFVIVTNVTWEYKEPNNGADFAPQLGLSTNVQNLDGRMGNVVYRNGYLWFAHTVFVPTNSPTHSAIQWYQLDPNFGLTQFGRIEDTTSTNYYAFPSIAVNRFNDVLIGFSRYSSNQYVSADYAFRAFNDRANTMETELSFKSGEDSYLKQELTTPPHNRWGDYSATQVDPLNDADFWTVQEYAGQHNGTETNLSGRWGVWWANVTVTVPPNDNFASATVISGAQGTTNGANIRATREPGEPNHAGNAGGASVWYNWTSPTNGSVTIDTIGSAFDTLLAVYTGTVVSNLTSVASDNGSAGGGASRVTFSATSGTVYRIAVDGFDGVLGDLVLNWLQPIPPDFVLEPESQIVYKGSNVTFSAEAIGIPNPTYQWQFDNSNISGATSSNYTITGVQTNNGGDYAVVASNSAGSVTSAVAVLTVAVDQATLSGFLVTNSTFQFTVSEVSGLNYIVEANTNLTTTNWVAIVTNTAPFTISDTAFTNNQQRFYRALYKP